MQLFIFYILRMKAKNYQFLNRNGYYESKAKAIDSGDRSKDRYRNSIATDNQLSIPKISNFQFENRFSMGINPSIREKSTSKSQHAMQNIRNTLALLQTKIDNAKQELKGNNILGKSIIQQEENETSKTFDLISFIESENSKLSEEEKYRQFNHKKGQNLQRAYTLIDFKKVKSYYKSELAKIFMADNQKANEHLSLCWTAIKAFSSQMQANPEYLNKSPSMKCSEKITLVLGLDETLVNAQKLSKSAEDIKIGVQGGLFLSIRPHAISFLKKMRKKFDIVVFSTRCKKESDLILQELDPLNQLISLRLYKEHCNEIRPNIFLKDLTLLNREISSVLLVDSSPYAYLKYLSNGIPILPYQGGNDSELYALEKYLEDLAKSRDPLTINNNYFQLKKYANFNDPLEAAKKLYFTKQ